MPPPLVSDSAEVKKAFLKASKHTAMHPPRTTDAFVNALAAKRGLIAHYVAKDKLLCMLRTVCFGISGYVDEHFVQKLLARLPVAIKAIRAVFPPECAWHSDSISESQGLFDILGGVDWDSLTEAETLLAQAAVQDTMLDERVLPLLSLVLGGAAFLVLQEGSVAKVAFGMHPHLLEEMTSASVTTPEGVRAQVVTCVLRNLHYYPLVRSNMQLLSTSELMGRILDEEAMMLYLQHVKEGIARQYLPPSSSSAEAEEGAAPSAAASTAPVQPSRTQQMKGAAQQKRGVAATKLPAPKVPDQVCVLACLYFVCLMFVVS